MTPHINPQTMTALRKLHVPRGGMARPKKAAGPWLRIQQNRQWTIVQLTLLEAPGTYRTHTVRVNNDMIRQYLLKHGVRIGELEVGFSLGGLWRGIKKVAKKVGITKVLKVASSVGKSIISNPIVNTLMPVTGIANVALKATSGLISAASHLAKAKRTGDKRGVARAKKLIQATQRAAKRGHPVAKTALAQSARIYKIAITPA